MELHRVFRRSFAALWCEELKSSSKPSSFTFDVPMACACVLILDQKSGFAQSDLVPFQHFFVIAPRSRYNLAHIGFCFNTLFGNRELDFASPPH